MSCFSLQRMVAICCSLDCAESPWKFSNRRTRNLLCGATIGRRVETLLTICFRWNSITTDQVPKLLPAVQFIMNFNRGISAEKASICSIGLNDYMCTDSAKVG